MSTLTIPSSTPGSTTPGGMSKKDRKALRKQLMAKKQELLAKRNAAGVSAKPSLPADLPKPVVRPQPKRTPSPRRTAAVPVAAATPLVTLSAPTRPSRHVAWPATKAKSLNDRPKRRVYKKEAAAPGSVLPGGAVSSGAVSRPSAPAASPESVMSEYEPMAVAQAVVPIAMGETPGPLQRGAAGVESACRRVVRGIGHVRQWLRVEPDEASAYGSLPGVVWPLRLCGLLSVAGAATMATQMEGMRALALGFGLGIAVIQLALAEIARAVWGLIREQ